MSMEKFVSVVGLGMTSGSTLVKPTLVSSSIRLNSDMQEEIRLSLISYWFKEVSDADVHILGGGSSTLSNSSDLNSCLLLIHSSTDVLVLELECSFSTDFISLMSVFLKKLTCSLS